MPPPLRCGDALFLDVDGSLFEFSVDPSSTRASPAQRSILQRVSRFLDGAVALVSGRSIAMLDRIFEPLAPVASGLHGLEMRTGIRIDRGAMSDGRQLRSFIDDAQQRFAALPGVLVEDKQDSFALHWRAAPDAADRLTSYARQVVERLEGYCLQPGNHVIEVRPEGPHKGDAISRFMLEAPFAARVPVFVGDDLTDEPGFEVVNAGGGVSILVGTRPGSVALHALQDPAAVWAWLDGVP